MKKLLSSCALSVSILCAPAHANVALDFEGINTASAASEIPAGYGGLTWENGAIFKSGVLGDLNGVTSGDWFGFVSTTFKTRAASSTPFSALSIYLTGSSAQLSTIKIEGFTYDPGEQFPLLAYSFNLSDLATTPQKFDLNFLEINEIRFAATDVRAPAGYDDLEISGTPTPWAGSLLRTVPQPATLALLGIGLFTLGFVQRLKRRRAAQKALLRSRSEPA